MSLTGLAMKTLRSKFLAPLFGFFLLAIISAATFHSLVMLQEVRHDAEGATSNSLLTVKQILELSKSLIQSQVQGSMTHLKRDSADIPIPRLLADAAELVDSTVDILGGTATIFVMKDGDFVRTATTIQSKGARVVGTVLDKEGPAYKALILGNSYYGVVDILGDPYITGYEPITKDGEVLGAYYVGYRVDLGAVAEVIGMVRVMHDGFVTVSDASGVLRFKPSHLSETELSKAMEDTNFVKSTLQLPGWGFIATAFTSEAEVALLSRNAILTTAVIAVCLCILILWLTSFLLNRNIIAPLGGELHEVVEIARRLATGDLRVIPPDSGADESLMASLRLMHENLRRLVQDVQQAGVQLNTSYGNLSKTENVVCSPKEDLSDLISTEAATPQELAAANENVVESLQSVTQDVKALAELANQLQSSLSKFKL